MGTCMTYGYLLAAVTRAGRKPDILSDPCLISPRYFNMNFQVSGQEWKGPNTFKSLASNQMHFYVRTAEHASRRKIAPESKFRERNPPTLRMRSRKVMPCVWFCKLPSVDIAYGVTLHDWLARERRGGCSRGGRCAVLHFA